MSKTTFIDTLFVVALLNQREGVGFHYRHAARMDWFLDGPISEFLSRGRDATPHYGPPANR